jgi:hypothetical protein
MTNFRNLDEAVEAIKSRAITTSQGSFIKLSDMEELLAQFRQSKAENAVPQDGAKTFAGAAKLASQDPEIQALFAPVPVAQQVTPTGQSTPTATEGVKS